MHQHILKFCLLVLASALLFACEPEKKLDDNNPFAVMAKKYRNPQEALIAKKILEDKGVSPYLINYDAEGEGRWHGIFLGSYPTLETMMKGKIDFEDQYGLKEIERINFNQLNSGVLSFDYDQVQPATLNNNLAQVDSPVLKLIQQLPFSTANRLKSLKLIQQMDGDAKRAQAVTKYQFDFPRGISPSGIYQNADVILEAHYENDLTPQRFSIQLIKLKGNHNLGESIADRFSKQILETREYDLEQQEAFEVGNLKGHITTLSPRQGRIRHYIVLSDTNQDYLYFLQSREKFFPINQLKTLCKSLNQAQNATQLPYINKILSAIPNQTDTLVAINYQRLESEDEESVDWWTGNDQVTYFFYTEEAGFWKTELNLFSTNRDAQHLYLQTVANRNFRAQTDSLVIGNQKAVIVYKKRRSKDNRKRIVHPESLHFKRGTTLGWITNRNRAWLSKEELIAKSKSFKLD